MIGIITFSVSIIILLFSAQLLIKGSVRIARSLGIGEFTISNTVIQLAVALPLIITGLMSMNPVLGINQAIGAVLAIVTLGIFIINLIKPLRLSKNERRESLLLAGIALVILLTGIDSVWSFLDGVIIFAASCLYIYFVYRLKERGKHNIVFKHSLSYYLIIPVAVFNLVFSSYLLMDSSNYLVNTYNISLTILGIIILGILLSLPKIITNVSITESMNLPSIDLLGSAIIILGFVTSGLILIAGEVAVSPSILIVLTAILASGLMLYASLKEKNLSKVESIALLIIYGITLSLLLLI